MGNEGQFFREDNGIRALYLLNCRKEWDLASHCLELILIKPEEDEEEWMPDPECLLMRSEVILKIVLRMRNKRFTLIFPRIES